ncbi:LuxR C-terminal-related transcriptional regulator [Methylobacterium oryzihabitans]|uniref:Response regulator transcription factor n=1 Tax=Methylobacterium oryzihabitans TaxID=2499852 RepID=A0A437P740_9HYPH|nr:response regulator transcription factor [Methylobacterium oryzihabitans]RVU18101.1 response regulator transcription factor [Methylobacterium oryzihabitans]
MSDAVNVLIVDEPVELGETLRATLEHAPALRTVAEEDLDGSSEAVALVFAPGRGPERIAALRARFPEIRVLVSFLVADAAEVARIVAAGADAFVARGATPAEVCGAILALGRGAALDADAKAEAAQDEAAGALGLTAREAEVLRFLSAGFSNKEVARRLAVSVRTVETHRLNLRRKTKTGRLKDLVQLARQLGLAPVVDAEPPAARPAPRMGLHRAVAH